MSLPFIKYISPNFTLVELNKTTMYFSYTLLIAFKTTKSPLIVRQNIWNTITDKHLNIIDNYNYNDRVNEQDFINLWNHYNEQPIQ